GPGTSVRRHALPRVPQERRIIDEVEQITEPTGDILSRPTVQLGLPSSVPRSTPNQHSATPQHRCSPVHLRTLLSLLDWNTLPPLPRYTAFPRSEYYDGSAPPAPSADVAPIPSISLAGSRKN